MEWGAKYAKAFYEATKNQVKIDPKSVWKNGKLCIPIEVLWQFKDLILYSTAERSQESIDRFLEAFKRR